VRKWIEGSGDLASRRFGCHQTCESALLHMRRSCYHYRLLVVDASGTCDGACSCLDVSHSTLPHSTFGCPSVVDASPCLPNVLSCGWRSVDVDAAVSVQRTAVASGVGSV
jgi:hypothetical protein